jgi:hypothetical protein
MSENWIFQVSVKTPNGSLFNVRGENPDEFAANLAFAHKNASQVKAFCNDFTTPTNQPSGGGAGTEAPPAHPVTPPPAPAAPSYDHQPPSQGWPAPRAGAVTIASVNTFTGTGKTGKPWTRFAVKFSDGRAAATFDALIGKLAQSFQANGESCIPQITPNENPKFAADLDSLGRA